MSEEAKLVFDKSYVCPICDNKIKAKTIRSGVARFDRTCVDLRPIYKNINVTKYDVVSCNHCGYSAIARNFNNLTPVEKMNIQKNVMENFISQESDSSEIYSFETALKRYKLALISANYKGTKASDIGYICLKMCWLYQDMADNIESSDDNLQSKYLTEAQNASNIAYEYLEKARISESSPICGMDENTYDYLLAALAYQKQDYTNAISFLSGVITSRSTNKRLKDKALDLKELIMAKRA